LATLLPVSGAVVALGAGMIVRRRRKGAFNG
jgi:LPXTG-motif cell wall-anchored protein